MRLSHSLYAAVALLLSSTIGVARAAPTSANGKTNEGRVALATKRGKLSTVHVVQVRRLAPDEANEYGAPGGVHLTFVIVRKPGVDGLFTLTELRDLMVDGRSYAAMTREQLGTQFEPQTAIWDPRDVRIGSKTIQERFGTVDGDAMVMETAIYGAPVRPGAKARATVKVGWNKETEPLEFELPLAAAK